jgi:hypothetical protein
MGSRACKQCVCANVKVLTKAHDQPVEHQCALFAACTAKRRAAPLDKDRRKSPRRVHTTTEDEPDE